MNKITQRSKPARIHTALKTILDYILTILGLLILSPIFLLIALLVRIDSPGPLLYRRRVLGRGGEQFDAFKFRTMREDGDKILEASPQLKEALAKNHKLKTDPRLTRSGEVLRKYSLDELPQLFNVLLGQMSLVGPRMISPPELVNYGDHSADLLSVKPGITGLWQVSGRADTTYQERVKLDMHYIHKWTIWLDLYLLMATLPAVLSKKGAY